MAEVIDGILIREVETKNIMTKSSLPVGGYSVNPYVGCTHACKYCYASFMKRFTGHTEESRIVGFEVSGHSGYADAGEDIVCAAVTSAIRLVEATVNDVMGLCAAVKVNERETSITLRLPGGLASDAESTCQNLLTGLMVYLAQLHDEYPDNIEVMEA